MKNINPDANQRIFAGIDKSKLQKSSSASIQRLDMVTRERAAVLFHVGPDIQSEGDLVTAVSNGWGNKVRLLDGSAHYPVKDNPSLVLAFVGVNRDTRTYDDEGLKGMTAVTANVFRDEQDGVWRKVGDGDAAMLARESSDDLKAILEARRSLRIETASVDVELAEKAAVGEAVVWYDMAKEKIRHGVLLTPDLAYDLQAKVGCTLDPKQIVAAADVRSDISAEIAAKYHTERADTMNDANNGGQLTRDNRNQRMVTYMRVLFGKHPEYFSKLTTLISRGYGSSSMKTA